MARFPTTPVLDGFAYSNGAIDAVSGGAWDNNVFADPGDGGLEVIGGAVRTATVAGIGNAWYQTLFPADQEAYFDVATAGNYHALLLRVQSPGTTGGDGYVVEVEGTTYTVFRMDNATGTLIVTGTVPALADGDGFGASIVGSTIQAYRRSSGGFDDYGPAVRDTVYQGSGYIGIAFEDQGVRPVVDSFGGGAYVPELGRFSNPARPLIGASA